MDFVPMFENFDMTLYEELGLSSRQKFTAAFCNRNKNKTAALEMIYRSMDRDANGNQQFNSDGSIKYKEVKQIVIKMFPAGTRNMMYPADAKSTWLDPNTYFEAITDVHEHETIPIRSYRFDRVVSLKWIYPFGMKYSETPYEYDPDSIFCEYRCLPEELAGYLYPGVDLSQIKVGQPINLYYNDYFETKSKYKKYSLSVSTNINGKDTKIGYVFLSAVDSNVDHCTSNEFLDIYSKCMYKCARMHWIGEEDKENVLRGRRFSILL